jgi:hypothetical protein
VLLLSRSHISPSIIFPNHETTDSGSNPGGDVLPLQDPSSGDNSDQAKRVMVE